MSLLYDNSRILNSEAIIQQISNDSLQDQCMMYKRSPKWQNVFETCVKKFSYPFHFNGNIRLSCSLRWQFWMSTIGRSGSIIQFLSFYVGVDYDRWSLSVSLSLGCHYKHRNTEAMKKGPFIPPFDC